MTSSWEILVPAWNPNTASVLGMSVQMQVLEHRYISMFRAIHTSVTVNNDPKNVMAILTFQIGIQGNAYAIVSLATIGRDAAGPTCDRADAAKNKTHQKG